MSRVKLQKGKQREFLNRIAKYFDFDWSKIAKISNVCDRSLRDWRREKYNMNYKALLRLHKISNIPVPKIVKILPEFWSVKKFARKGTLKRNQMYGNPGTLEGRRKGGLTTMRRFREDPEFARRYSFKLRIPIQIPSDSTKLAEFIGIMLGDGFIKSNRTQLGIAFNTETDYAYGGYVRRLTKALFNLNPSICHERNCNGATLLVSSRNLVDFLISKGLKVGDKVINQVNIPNWIGLKKEYNIACLKGLIDTDGSFYLYKHKVFNKIYNNFAMCFTNHSSPLLKSVYDILKILSFNPIMSKDGRIYLHKKKEIDRYFKEIGTNNPKHLSKFNKYLEYRRNA